MTSMWGPAFDAEMEYRRSAIIEAARPRTARRPARAPRARTTRARGARQGHGAQAAQVALAAAADRMAELSAGVAGSTPLSASPRR